MRPIAINGRFLMQRLTGVQRVAAELTRACDAIPDLPVRLLAPPGAAAPFLSRIRIDHVGRGSGQLWEQRSLPRAARDAFLLNLGNTAPLLAGRNQLVLIHDAGAFDTPESYSLAFRTWYRVLHRALVLRGARIATVSEFSRGRLAQHLGLDPADIAVIPEGGEHILRTPADTDILHRHGLERGRFVLTVGTRAAHKNLDALAAAASLLGERSIRLASVGSVEASVFRAAGAGGALALGRVSDTELRALYEHALCLVFPSRYEGFGLPPLEAMACGCPVVAARAGAVQEVCGDAALWFDAEAPVSLVAALTRLLDEPGLAGELRRAGLARAQRFTWPEAARALLALADARLPEPAA